MPEAVSRSRSGGSGTKANRADAASPAQPFSISFTADTKPRLRSGAASPWRAGCGRWRCVSAFRSVLSACPREGCAGRGGRCRGPGAPFPPCGAEMCRERAGPGCAAGVPAGRAGTRRCSRGRIPRWPAWSSPGPGPRSGAALGAQPWSCPPGSDRG